MDQEEIFGVDGASLTLDVDLVARVDVEEGTDAFLDVLEALTLPLLVLVPCVSFCVTTLVATYARFLLGAGVESYVVIPFST